MPHTHYAWLFLIFVLISGSSKAQVTADFSANVTTGCGSLQVSFTNLSNSTSGPITSLAWNLGGVNSSTENPGRIFGTPGSYEICLTATDSQGNVDTECRTNYITVFSLPNPEFEVTQLQGCAPLNAVFTDLSTSDNGIQEWIWGLGGSTGVVISDGSISSIASTYTTPDNYTISLTIKDNNNCVNTITKTDLITVFPDPEISISVADSFGCTTPFIPLFTNDNIENDITYFWGFGNGQSHVGDNPPVVIYTEPGNYDVIVIANNNQTVCQDTTILNNFIQVGFPVDVSYTTASNCIGNEIQFMDNSSEPADSVRWDFGDGNFSTEINPSHTFTTSNCFTVKLTRYTLGCPSEGTLEDCITILRNPTAAIDNNNNSGCEIPHTVQFASFSSSNNVTWLWDFMDGTTSTDPQPSHTFTEFGSYPVRVLITNEEGCQAEYVQTIEVIETAAALATDVIWGCTPLLVTLDENSNTSSNIVSWDWEIYDENENLIFNSDLENPNTTIVDTGFYEVRLTVINAEGCSSSAIFDGFIAVGQEVIPNFVGSPLETCVDAIVSFTDLSVGNPDFWIWDFGDGAVLEDYQNPSHEYLDTGYFDVQLFIFDNGCGSDTLLEDYIHVNAPIGNATIERNCENPYTISFIDGSFGVDSVFWDFGEAGVLSDTSTLLSPIHTFRDTGCFNVIHEVYNFTTGCVDVDTIPVCITDPLAVFTLTNTEGCVPLLVEVTNNSLDADAYQWIAPDGVVSNPGLATPTISFNNPGLFNNIRLVVTDEFTCQDTFDFPGQIRANGVMVNFNATPEGGCLPMQVDLVDNSSSFFSTPVSWDWNIGDGLSLQSGTEASFFFDTVGQFSVELTVTDDAGCVGTKKETALIDVTDPKASFTADTISCTTDMVSFTSTSSGGTLSYLWDFGDNLTSTEAAPQHQYATEGNFDVCLTITNQYGCTDMICKENYVAIANPVASFSVDSSFAFCPPLLANFQNNSINTNNYTWDYGDNSGTSNLEIVSHVYTIPGAYDVTLIAGTTPNCQDTLVINNMITLEGPIGTFSYAVDTSCAPVKVTFTGSSTDFYDYIWDYGNGDLDTIQNVISNETVYYYSDIDKYVPKLILIDDSNCVRAIESPDTINVTGINVDFIAIDTALCDGAPTTSFINLTQSTQEITSLEWLLEGGDPRSSQVSEPTVNYPVAGIYDVGLVVATDFCRDTLILENYITVGSTPNINFTPSATLGCSPLDIGFEDTSSVEVGALTMWRWDFGDGNTSGQSDPLHTFDTAGNYQVVLNLTSDLGCTAIDSQEIMVLPTPVVSVNEGFEICLGATVSLNGNISGDTTGITYGWLNHPDLSCTACLAPQVTPASTTTYGFYAAGMNGCADTVYTTIVTLPGQIPNINISEDTTICVSSIIQLNVSGGDNVFSYQWDQSRSGLSCYEFCNNPIANPLTAMTYVVTVTNALGCSAQDSVTINIVDEFQPLAGVDRTICVGDSVTLITGVADLTWTNPTGLTCAYCSDPIAFPETTKVFRMEANTEEGCLIQDSLTVTVLTLDDINAGLDQILCAGSAVTLVGSGLGVPYWLPDISLDNPGTLSPTARPLMTTDYILQLTEDICVMEDTVRITIVEKTTIETSDLEICNGDIVTLEVTGNADFYNWIPSESLSDNTIANPDADPSKTITYTVIGNLQDCPSDTATVTVTVDQGPAVNLAATFYKINEEPVVLNANIELVGDYTYSWFPESGLSCADCPNPTVDSSGIGQTYTLLITDMNTGCEKELQTKVEELISCPENLIWMPNAFSPNNDGENDELVPYSNTITTIEKFQIFDRWGGLVFSSQQINRGWDGRMKGEAMPIGVYVYFLEARCPVNNQTILLKGDVTLAR